MRWTVVVVAVVLAGVGFLLLLWLSISLGEVVGDGVLSRH